MKRFPFFLLLLPSLLFAAAQHCRDCSCLSPQERAFAEELSVSKRKIFCGQFSAMQRQAAMREAAAEDLSPEEAVVQVMEETGLSLAVKSKRQCGVDD